MTDKQLQYHTAHSKSYIPYSTLYCEPQTAMSLIRFHTFGSMHLQTLTIGEMVMVLKDINIGEIVSYCGHGQVYSNSVCRKLRNSLHKFQAYVFYYNITSLKPY